MTVVKDERLETKELIQKMGISDKTWKTNKKDILVALADSCEYEVEYKGRSTIYHFLNDGEYEYQRKNKAASAKEQARDAAFESAIVEIISEQPLNTAANVARIMNGYWPEITDLGYTEGTVYEYTRVRMRKWFGKSVNDNGTFEDLEDMNMRKGYINDTVWCKLDKENSVYIPMNEAEIDDFINMVSANLKAIKKEEVNLLASFDAGTITKEEYNAQSGELRYEKYTNAKNEFRAKYGYFPIKVPEYVLYE